MSDGKHSSKGRHSKVEKKSKNERTTIKASNKRSKKNSNKSKWKIIILLLLLILLLSSIYFIILYFNKNEIASDPESKFDNSKNEIEESNVVYEQSSTYSLSEEYNSTENIKVEGTDYLEIIKYKIIPDKEQSTVTATFKNTSNEAKENVQLFITLYDKDQKEITRLNYAIDQINSMEEVDAYATVGKDLSDCTTCVISLRKK